MIISNNQQYIFIHIMKAAGTSMSVKMDETLKWNDVIVGGSKLGEKIQAEYKKKYLLHKHSRAREIKDVVGSEVWNKYFTFTIVRNPYSRAISFYTYVEKMVKSNGYIKRLGMFKMKDPNANVWQWPATLAYMEGSNFSEFIRNEKFLNSMGADKQVNWVTDDEGNVIVDHIGKIENIDEDLRVISKKIGVDLTSIEKKNPSRRKNSLSHYLSNENDYEYLFKMYEDDFKTLGYDPDLRF